MWLQDDHASQSCLTTGCGSATDDEGPPSSMPFSLIAQQNDISTDQSFSAFDFSTHRVDDNSDEGIIVTQYNFCSLLACEHKQKIGTIIFVSVINK